MVYDDPSGVLPQCLAVLHRAIDSDHLPLRFAHAALA
jgi:hypothetical protein